MDKPRIRHIAINVQDREKAAAYYKNIFKLEEKERGPNGTIYLSDGFVDIALINTQDLPLGHPSLRFPGDQCQGHRRILWHHGKRQCLRRRRRELDTRPGRQSGGRLGTWLAGLTEWQRFRLNDQVVTCQRHPKLFPQLATEAIGCALILTAAKPS
jgi:catechol 2,3-dioxygenase-like lactoylglutathione lyase family enzyme